MPRHSLGVSLLGRMPESAACPPDFSFRLESRRRKRPLFFPRYMWRGRRVITPWNFPRIVQFPWMADSASLFFFLPPFFFSLFLLFFGRSSFESFHKVRLPHPTLSSSSLDRARWDASGIVSHRHDSREFIVMVSWTFLGRYRAKKETIRRERERERERIPVLSCLFLLGNALVIDDGWTKLRAT